VQASSVGEDEDRLGFTLDLALGASFSVECFSNGHGHGLGGGRLPVEGGTELRELQVAGRLGDVTQKHDE